jgi:hypothetical protein
VFDALVSFDSHIDTQLLGYRKDVMDVIERDEALLYAAGRASTHAIFSRMFTDFISPIALLIPKVALETDLASFEDKLVKRLEGASESESERLSALLNDKNKLNAHVMTIRKLYDIDVISSPPKDPVSTVNNLLEDSELPVFDVDLDYFAEMQQECYTPLRGAKPHELGNVDRVLRLIRSTKPELILVSEATVQALNTPDSNTNRFLKKLENMGYKSERFFVYKDDEEARFYLDRWGRFVSYVQEKIVPKYWSAGMPSQSDIAAEGRDIERYAREYFG